MSPPRIGQRQLALLILVSVATSACWRTGEPTPSEGVVAWAAYPESVTVGSTFLFEFAGPITPTACGRLDTATLAQTESSIVLGAQRSTFGAVCAPQRISFYEARPVTIETAGTYSVTTDDGRELGRVVATDSGPFSPIRTYGEGTLREIPSCLLFGPGWIGNQRVFALSGDTTGLHASAGTDQIVHVRGTLRGFASCGSWGSRPRIRVDTAWVTDREASDWYESPETMP